jgi:hypothetical protein
MANMDQDWKHVDSVAWVILLTTAFECLIEGNPMPQIVRIRVSDIGRLSLLLAQMSPFRNFSIKNRNNSGMAFTLTLQDDIGAGFSVLFAMLLKMIPVSIKLCA